MATFFRMSIKKRKSFLFCFFLFNVPGAGGCCFDSRPAKAIPGNVFAVAEASYIPPTKTAIGSHGVIPSAKILFISAK
jgi:hypothetical protein